MGVVLREVAQQDTSEGKPQEFCVDHHIDRKNAMEAMRLDTAVHSIQIENNKNIDKQRKVAKQPKTYINHITNSENSDKEQNYK